DVLRAPRAERGAHGLELAARARERAVVGHLVVGHDQVEDIPPGEFLAVGRVLATPHLSDAINPPLRSFVRRRRRDGLSVLVATDGVANPEPRPAAVDPFGQLLRVHGQVLLGRSGTTPSASIANAVSKARFDQRTRVPFPCAWRKPGSVWPW